MLHRIHAPERGASLPEYAAIILLVAGLVAVVVAGAGLPGRVEQSLGTALCTVENLGSADCADPQDRPGGGATQSVTGAGDGAEWLVPLEDLPRPAEQERRGEFGQWMPPEDEEWFEFEDRGDYTWDCGKVFDVACKIGGGFAQGGRDLWDGVASAACLAHLCSHDGFRENWSAIGQVFRQSPLTTAEQMWDGFTEPFVENWREGGPGKAIAYGLPAAIGGLFKAFKHIGKKDLPDLPSAGDVRADLADARDAAEHGDLDAADEAIESLEDKVEDLRERADAAGCPIAAPAPGPGRPGGSGAVPMAVAAPAAGLVLADGGGCDAAEQLARDIGVTGDRSLEDIVAREQERRDFFATRKGRRVADRLEQLTELADEAGTAADRGRVRTAQRKARQAETIAADLRRQADNEEDPQRRSLLEDAADTAEVSLLRAQDNARTAAVTDTIGNMPGTGRGTFGPDRIADLWRRTEPVIDYEGHGSPYIDHANTDPETGRPVLRVDRGAYNSDAELSAAVAQALILDDRGYNRVADDGLRGITRDRRGEWNRGDLSEYVEASRRAHEEAYLASVRTLEIEGVDPAHVADPVLRDVYREALGYAEEHADDPSMFDARGKPLKGDELTAARENLLRTGIFEAMGTPLDGLGGRTPMEVFAEEYESVFPRGDDDY
ncbi:hypothetical protein ACFOVU_13515 [Nocardiopsis sediminis]|uniref:Uncharacterized protein n=1 Tax=Nocardiopsis sediminis TaxID=1778267 RepID=A0ABV8FPI1_9ACTN